MNVLNLVLNLAGLVLWLGWTMSRLEPPRGQSRQFIHPARTARPRRHWFLVALAALVAGRGWLYHAIGRDVNWIAQLDLGVVRLPFNSAVPLRAFIFSAASFTLFLAGFYLWLLLLRAVNRHCTDPNPWLRVITLQLGWLARLPWPLGLALPGVAIAGAWYFLDPVLVRSGLMAAPRSATHLWQQAAVLGLGIYTWWKYLLVGVLFLQVVNTYLYVGARPFLAFIGLTARSLLRPLGFLPLRLGRVDFAPLVGIALVLLFFTWMERGLAALLPRLPL